MRATLTASDGREFRIDTPDPALVGAWLKSIFSDLLLPPQGLPAPIEFMLRLEA